MNDKTINKPLNNFKSVCQCCNRIIKGSESKFIIEFDIYPVNWGFASFKKEKTYGLCRGCRRSVELFIKKGGVLK